MTHTIEITMWAFLGSAVIVGQAAPAGWVEMAREPFAFTALAFLIWSMVQLIRTFFDAYKAANTDTINALRSQIVGQKDFQDTTLVGLLKSVTAALERDADASSSTSRAWGEVHEDFRALINALRVRPCLHDSDLPQPDLSDVDRVRRRQERQERRSDT